MKRTLWSDELHVRIAAAMRDAAPVNPVGEPRLRAAISDAVSRPGKLVRARLALTTAEAHGLNGDVGMQLAIAVEYFHLASLILDDLPCMDDSAVRRGHPCVHRVYGESTAILAALALITRAYALAGFALAAQPGVVRQQAHACIDACLGACGIVGGQALDLRFGVSDRSAREVSRIALGKTGAMLTLALLLPTLVVAPAAVERRHLGALCVYWGLAFQALDDVQDVIGSSADGGKTTGRDRALVRPNLALALGLPAARRRVARLLEQADRRLRMLQGCRPSWSCLAPFHHYLVQCAEPVTAAARAVAA